LPVLRHGRILRLPAPPPSCACTPPADEHPTPVASERHDAEPWAKQIARAQTKQKTRLMAHGRALGRGGGGGVVMWSGAGPRDGPTRGGTHRTTRRNVKCNGGQAAPSALCVLSPAHAPMDPMASMGVWPWVCGRGQAQANKLNISTTYLAASRTSQPGAMAWVLLCEPLLTVTHVVTRHGCRARTTSTTGAAMASTTSCTSYPPPTTTLRTCTRIHTC